MSNGDLNSYIDQIKEILIESDKIVRLIGDDEPNMYSSRKPSPENPRELLDTRILSYGYVPNIQDKVASYITIQPSNFSTTKGGYFMAVGILFNIFTHENLVKTNYGNRLFLLHDELRKAINGERLAIGKLILDRGGIIPNLQKPYSGYWLSCNVVDFNSR